MRFHRLLLPLTAIPALGLASPAMAAEAPVDVVDDSESNFFFSPTPQQIDVGDTVVWTFNAQNAFDHTTTSSPGESEKWDSGLQPAGATPFRRTFTKPGRFDYLCTPHANFPMTGTIVVGEDEVSDTVDRFKRVRRGDTVTVSFELNEAATATYRIVKGPSRRTVKEGREKAGRHSFRLKNLKPGKYRGKLTLADDFDNKTAVRNRFVVP